MISPDWSLWSDFDNALEGSRGFMRNGGENNEIFMIQFPAVYQSGHNLYTYIAS